MLRRDIKGNQRNIDYFDQSAKLDKLSHAYIICGPKGSGKTAFVKFLVQGLMCEARGAIPCGNCAFCTKTETGNHPDIKWVTHEKPKVISVEEVRTQVVEDIVIKPYYGPYKIYVIDDAHLLNANGQNALLKTIEEPPAYGIIFIVTRNIDGLLDTIRSRCLKIDMEELDPDTIKKVLVSELGADAGKAREAAAFARGNLGRAMELVKGEGLTELKAKVETIAANVRDMDIVEMNKAALDLGEADTLLIAEMFYTWFRDVLVAKSTSKLDDLYFLSHTEIIKEQADKLSYESINYILDGVENVKDQLNANVKAEAVFETLFLRIRGELLAS